MTKITMIGAGSAGFCRGLVNDIVLHEALQDAHIALMDVDGARLKLTHRVMQAMREQHDLKCSFTATTDRREALKGASFAISMIQVGGLEPYKLDIGIPLKYGVDQSVGDTLNPGGVFRGLRHVPALLEVLRDMEEVCPGDAIFMNYANPMAIVSWALARAHPNIQSVGLCHGVQHTTATLCRWLKINPDECDVLTAGINHMAWFLKFHYKGRDLYPRMWRKLDREGPIQGEEYRFEIMKATGYFMTESPGHLSEYLPYFRKRRDLQELFGGPGFLRETGAYLQSCLKGFKLYQQRMARWSSGREPVPFSRQKSLEYAADIINARVTGERFSFAGNVLNKGFIANLPYDSCVEVPVFVDRLGMHGTYVGKLPEQCAALCRSNISVQELAVKAALEADYEAAFHACMLDPLTAAVLAPHEIRNMVDELFAAQKKWLPQFRGRKPTARGHFVGRIKNRGGGLKRGAVIKTKIGHYD